MESPYIIFGILILITGIFLAIAMSIQFCACAKAVRRIQREKARLQEIQEAAAQPPPPYALVVSSCHLNPNNNTSADAHHQHEQCQCHPYPHTGGGNVRCIIETINPHEQSSVVSPSSSNRIPATNSSCGCAANSVCISNLLQDGTFSSIQCKSSTGDIELPPTYDEAIKIENEMATKLTKY